MTNKLNFYNKIFENLKNSKETIIIKILKDKENLFNKKDFFIEEISFFSPFFQEIIQKEIEKLDENLIIMFNEKKERVFKEDSSSLIIFIERIIKKPKLFIFGSGHCGFVLAKIAHMCSFETYLIDDRSDYFKNDNIDKIVTCIESSFDSFLNKLKELEIEIEGNDSFVVIVTRGHKHDKTVLEQLINKNLKYLGMIGSKRKVIKTFDDIKQNFQNINLNNIYSPIGLDIGAKSPEEIAISILAEIMMVKNSKNAKSMNLIGE